MWWRVVLLCVYAIVVFVLARILETVAFYESGFVPRRLMDPLSLSVLRLKLILDRRGVSYHSIVEKKDLGRLLESTGDVREGELDTALGEDVQSAPTKNFTSAAHFYEEVEDTKDSVWLVQVSTNRKRPPLLDDDWTVLVKKLARFGVRTGLFDCASDYSLCAKKGWHSPRLILAYPKGNQVKDNVVMGSYKGNLHVNSVFDWVNANIKTRVKEIFNLESFRQDWLEFQHIDQKENTRFVYFGSHIPMFLPFVSVKFTGRAKIGRVDIRSKESKNILKMLGFDSIPLYLVITPERHYFYGRAKGEYFTFEAVELFLKSLCPEVNDTFKFSLYVVNLCAVFEFFIRQGSLFRRFGKFLWLIAVYNIILVVLWLPLIGIFKLSILQPCVLALSKIVRFFAFKDIAALVREDIILGRYSICLLTVTFFTYCIIIAIVQRRRTGGREDDMETTAPPWWSIEAGLNPYSPVASLTRPLSQQDLDLEEGMEMLIERLNSVPDLWLHPLVPSDYVSQLPTWIFGENPSQITVRSLAGVHVPNSAPPLSAPCMPILISGECVICIESYKLELSVLSSLPCGHSFHRACICEWLTRYKHHCPVCRWPAYKAKTTAIHTHVD